MKFEYNRDRKTLLNVINSKAEKKNIRVDTEKEKIKVSLEPGTFDEAAESIPVTFKGKLADTENGCCLEGKFTFGFYLYTMVIVAAILIIARFAWSAYKMQTGNIVLCAIAAVLLIVVLAVVVAKANKPKEIITKFLQDLNIK